MAVVFVLANIFALILCQPLLVNHPDVVMGSDAQVVQEFDVYQYYIYEASENRQFFCKEAFQVLVTCFLVIYGIVQAVKIRHGEDESDILLETIDNAHETISKVPKFFNATEKMFSVLEAKSKTVMTRMRTAERKIQENGIHDNLRKDLEFMIGSWSNQLKGLQSVGVDVREWKSDVRMNVHLTMINGLVDRELRKTETNMIEDSLSLEEATRDVHILQNHFRGKGCFERGLW